jgi:hypothetical protein
MAKHVDLEALTANVQALQLGLAKANANIALLNELKSAEKDATRITAELAKANDALAIGMADAVAAERASTYAHIKDISIAVSIDPLRANSVLAASFTVSVTRLSYDMNTRQSLPTVHTYEGLHTLPSEMYDYLMEVKPQAIPSIIMALVPGDYQGSMNAYWMGMRRGHLAE